MLSNAKLYWRDFNFFPLLSLGVGNQRVETCFSSLLPILVSFSEVRDALTKIYYDHKDYVDKVVKVN